MNENFGKGKCFTGELYVSDVELYLKLCKLILRAVSQF